MAGFDRKRSNASSCQKVPWCSSPTVGGGHLGLGLPLTWQLILSKDLILNSGHHQHQLKVPVAIAIFVENKLTEKNTLVKVSTGQNFLIMASGIND